MAGSAERVEMVTVIPPPDLTVRPPAQAAHDTDIPPSMPTRIPSFDVGQVARNVQVLPQDDDVYMVVPGVAWSTEKLDLTERTLLQHLDGVAPLWLVETSMNDIGRDELHSILCVLQARGLVEMCDGPSESGTFPSYRAIDESTFK